MSESIGKLMKVNVRASSMDRAKAVFVDLLGGEVVSERGADTVGDFDGAMVRVGDLVIDMLVPNQPDGAMAKTVEKRGEGLDSLCFQVESLDRVRERLAAQGVELAHEQAFHGHRLGFVRPRDACGVLLEFVEVAPDVEAVS